MALTFSCISYVLRYLCILFLSLIIVSLLWYFAVVLMYETDNSVLLGAVLTCVLSVNIIIFTVIFTFTYECIVACMVLYSDHLSVNFDNM